MNKHDKDYHIHTQNCRLKRELDPLLKEVETPESLSPENLPALVQGKKKQRLPGSYRPYLRLAAAFAAFALVVTAGVSVMLHGRTDLTAPPAGSNLTEEQSVISAAPDTEPSTSVPETGSSPTEDKKPPRPGDYDKIFQVIQSMHNRQDVGEDRFTGDDMLAEGWAPTKPTAPSGSKPAGNANGGASDKNDGHSQTNEQVVGVNEGDIIKTDGRYIYTVKTGKPDNEPLTASSISIHAVQPDGSLKLVSTIKNEGWRPRELYIDGNILTVLSVSVPKTDTESEGVINDFTFYGAATNAAVHIYDLSDRSKPVLINSYTQQGDILSSRYIGGYLYLATNYRPAGELIKDQPATYIPQITYPNSGKSECLPPDSIYLPEEPNSTNYVVVTAVNARVKQGKVAQKAVLGSGETVYCSENNFYVIGSQYCRVDGDSYKHRTRIIRFGLKKDTVTYSGSAAVEGRPLNQFSADEHNGYFRIATTDNQNVNRVYVLDKDLKQAGLVDHIADGEQIKSVRFSGDTGYVITFLQTDPLFVLDLKNPKQPKIVGELKIPGFSSYLHPFGNHLLIGIGTDADKDGRDTGFKISLFDVSDPKAPKEIHKLIIKDDYFFQNSMVDYDHKALFVDETKGLIGMPLRAQNKDQLINHFALFRISEKDGITLQTAIDRDGKVNQFEHKIENEYYNYVFKRGIYVGNTLYLFNGEKLMAFNYTSYAMIGEYPLG